MGQSSGQAVVSLLDQDNYIREKERQRQKKKIIRRLGHRESTSQKTVLMQLLAFLPYYNLLENNQRWPDLWYSWSVRNNFVLCEFFFFSWSVLGVSQVNEELLIGNRYNREGPWQCPCKDFVQDQRGNELSSLLSGQVQVKSLPSTRICFGDRASSNPYLSFRYCPSCTLQTVEVKNWENSLVTSLVPFKPTSGSCSFRWCMENSNTR